MADCCRIHFKLKLLLARRRHAFNDSTDCQSKISLHNPLDLSLEVLTRYNLRQLPDFNLTLCWPTTLIALYTASA